MATRYFGRRYRVTRRAERPIFPPSKKSVKRTAMIKRKPEDYTSNYMTREHTPITTIVRLKKYDYNDMFLFYKGVKVGEGSFEVVSKKKRFLHTEGVRLDKKFRDKGHGIYLYHHLISTAIRIGAKRLYSSTNLNKHSRRMWDVKLLKFYKVIPVMTRGCCSYCGSKEPRVLKFYIDLDKR